MPPEDEVPLRNRPSKSPGHTAGQTWGALRKAWRGYRIAKAKGEKAQLLEYATRIRTLQEQLGVEKSRFPELGLDA